MNRNLGYSLLVMTWFCWGFSYPATKIALETVDVWTSRSFVMLTAGLIMLLLGKVQGYSLGVPREQWCDLVIAAIFNMAIFQVTMTYGVELMSAGRTAVIVYTMPLWAALFALPILGEKLTIARLIALLAGLAGLVCLVSQDLTHLSNAPLGAFLTLLGAISFGFGTVWMKRRRWAADLTVIGGWQLLIGVVPVLIITCYIETKLNLSDISLDSWIALSYLILFANVIAYFSWFRVVAIFPAVVSGIGAMAVPVVGVTASAVVVNESVGWHEGAALLLICIGLTINLKSVRGIATS